MEKVTHKNWGVGTVIKRETYKDGKFTQVSEGGNYITVRFDNGKEVRLAIPASFKDGIIVATGALKDEVDNAVVENEKKRAEEKTKYGVSDGTRPIEDKDTRTAKKCVTIAPTGNLKADYETYLTMSGYEKTVVYQYSRSIDIVCKEEGLSCDGLVKNIISIIKKYDNGGEKEAIGNYQKRTVINALKRFREFVKINPPIITP